MSTTQQRDTAAGALQKVRAVTSASTVGIGRGSRGTGFVVAAGKVLTSAHNVRDRTTTVTFADNRAVQGEVVGIDTDGDIVVLAVDTGDAVPLSWGDAGSVVEGGEVFSASRGGGRLRVTRGDVSALDAEFRGPRGRSIRGGIEHTAAMARGSSGGPVVGADGAVVGVNTHRAGEGFYLARLADAPFVARVKRLIAGERITTPSLGVTLAPSTVAQRLRAAVGLSRREGLLVREVLPDSAAARSGVEEGDLIVAAGGHAVVTVDDLHAALDALGVERTLSVTLVSGDTERDVVVAWEPESA